MQGPPPLPVPCADAPFAIKHRLLAKVISVFGMPAAACEGVKGSCVPVVKLAFAVPACTLLQLTSMMLCLLYRAPETLLHRRRCQNQGQLADTMGCLPSSVRVRHACFCVLFSLHDWCPQLQNVSMTDTYILLSQGGVLAPVARYLEQQAAHHQPIDRCI